MATSGNFFERAAKSLEWLRSLGSRPPRSLTAEDRTSYEDRLRYEIEAGFFSDEELHAMVLECGRGVNHQELLELASQLIPKLRAEHDARVAAWPAQTDCDRLDAAFEALHREGIFAQHNVACCRNCSLTELANYLEAKWTQTNAWRGMAFYDNQCTQDAVEGQGLIIYFWAMNSKGKAVKKADCPEMEPLGPELARTLRAHNLRVELYPGETYVLVHLDYKRRAAPRNHWSADALDSRVRGTRLH